MKDWAIDAYGLQAAHRRSVLGRLRDAHRLHVSPLTWFPRQMTRSGEGRHQAEPRAAANLPSIGPGSRRDRRGKLTGMDASLHALHRRGVLVVDDNECNPQAIAAVEGSWKDAGLIGRPTDETLAAIIHADRLGMDLVTEDTDVRMLAGHWQVQTMTVSDLASSLAA